MGDENIEKQNVIEEEGISLNDPNHSGFLRYIVESKQEIEQVHEIELEPEPEVEQDFENKEDSEFIMTKKGDFEFIEPNQDGNLWKSFKSKCLAPCSNPKIFRHSFCSFFPIFGWLSTYSFKENLLADIVGGITVGVMHVPQGIAYALLSGVKPINGLYMSFFAPLFYMFFGTSRHMSLGSFAVVALMTGVANERIMSAHHPGNVTEIFLLDDYSHLPVNPVSIVSTLTFTVGLCQLLAAILKLEFLTSYFSDALVAGFTTGAAVHVFASQIDDILGVRIHRTSGPGYLFVLIYHLALKIPETNYWTLGASILAATFLIVGKDFLSPKIHHWTKMRIIVPYELILMIIATIVSYIFNFHNNHHVPIVGNVPAGFPLPKFPEFSLIPDCFSTGLAICVVTIAVHISMAKMIAKRLNYSIEPGQEIYALGLTSLFSGFFPVYPNSTALGRTMVQVEAGVRTQFAAIFTCLFLLAVILFLGPLFETLPLCILSTVIVVALRPMFKKFKDLPKLWKLSKYDFTIWFVSFLATVCIDVIGGLAVGVGFTLLTVIFRTQWPNWQSRISRPILTSNSLLIKRICIFEFESLLIFTNVEIFKTAARETIRNWTDRIPALNDNDKTGFYFVFDCSAMTQIDTMGLNAIEEIVKEIQDKTLAVIYYANARSHIRKLLLDSRVASCEDDFWTSIDDLLGTMKLKRTHEAHQLDRVMNEI